MVELVGPAGAGKTTLARALQECDSGVRVGPSLWGLPRPLLLASAIALVPTALTAARAGRSLRGAEYAQMTRLGALRRVLERERHEPGTAVVLDEGPVFGLSWLEVFFAGNGDPLRARWRARALADWASRLDVVVRLDGPDWLLATRIRERDKPHLVKGAPDPAIHAFNARFRRAFDQVIEGLADRRGPAVLGLPADGLPAETATRLLADLGEARDGR
jgi:hypothetical protein